MKRKFFSELALALALFTISGCNAEEPVNIPPGSKKILIAVFSYTGNTRQAAQAIQRKTGGTLIEIEPETPYSQDYQAVVKQGKEEVASGFLPKLKTKAANIRDYDSSARRSGGTRLRRRWHPFCTITICREKPSCRSSLTAATASGTA